MLSNGQQAADFIPILFDTIKAAKLTTQVACCDNDGSSQTANPSSLTVLTIL